MNDDEIAPCEPYCIHCAADETLGLLNEDERHIVVDVINGLVKGRSVYGPLNINKDTRDWDKEAREEERDLLIYRAIQAIKEKRNAK